ncbi:hypothetical protein HD806DRAFT_304652 [Xylariaceae sp. AK1471]|nr:hypothetical protein HD806DRAFT_304652 [Xylariaceae sp. AK1471]
MLLGWCQVQAGIMAEGAQSLRCALNSRRPWASEDDDWRAKCVLACLDRDIALSLSTPQDWEFLADGQLCKFMTSTFPAYYLVQGGSRSILSAHMGSVGAKAGAIFPEDAQPTWGITRHLLDGGYDAWHFHHDHTPRNTPSKSKTLVDFRLGFPSWGGFNILRYYLHFLDARIKDTMLSDCPEAVMGAMKETLCFVLTCTLHHCNRTTTRATLDTSSPCYNCRGKQENSRWGTSEPFTALHDIRLRHILVETAIELAKMSRADKHHNVLSKVMEMLTADHPFLRSSTRAAAVHWLDGCRDLARGRFAAAGESFQHAGLALEQDIQAGLIREDHAILREVRGLQIICEFLRNDNSASMEAQRDGRLQWYPTNMHTLSNVVLSVARNHQLFLYLSEHLFHDEHRHKAASLLSVVLQGRPRLGRDQFLLRKRSLSESDLRCAATRRKPARINIVRLTRDDADGLSSRAGAWRTLDTREAPPNRDMDQNLGCDKVNAVPVPFGLTAGGVLFNKYQELRDRADLDSAIQAIQDTLTAHSTGSSSWVRFRGILADALEMRYLETMSTEDL